MPELDWPSIVETEGRALLAAARQDEAAAVPACPGWTATDLVRHVALIHARSAVILADDLQERPSRSNGLLPEAPDQSIVDWAEEQLARLVAQLRADGDPARPVYTFSPTNSHAGFWHSRMAQETSVHRVDAEQAVGADVTPIPHEVGVHGIDELFDVFVPALGADRNPADGRTVHLHATDGDGEWLVTFGSDGLIITSGHAKGDAAVRAPAGQLLLWLWGRAPLDDLEVFGDRTAAEALRAVTTF